MKNNYNYNSILIINLIENLNNNFNYKFNLNKLTYNNINIIVNLINYLKKKNKLFYNTLISIIKYGKKLNILSNNNRVKYFKYIYFANINNVNLDNIKINDDSYYSITSYNDANYICNLIYKIYKTKNIIITDSTANIGGNTISFGLFNFKFINSIEIDELCSRYLIHNINCYNLKNIRVQNINYLDVYLNLYQDVVFLDPPWGGPEYKKKQNLDLYLDNINIITIIDNLFSNTLTSSIILKAPFNYNFNKLLNKFNNINNITIKIYKLNKYNIVYIYKQFKKIEL